MALQTRQQLRVDLGHRNQLPRPYKTIQRPLLAPAHASQIEVSTSSSQPDESGVPPGCSRYSVSLKKPLGIVLEQNKSSGIITVVAISPEGNADRTGLVSVGDQLIATTGVTYGKEEYYGGAKVRKGQQVVRISALGQSFKAIAAAIGSHPGNVEVKLDFQRCSNDLTSS